MASLGLFHSLWNTRQYVKALRELHRFESLGHSKDYAEIWEEVQEKEPRLARRSLKPLTTKRN